MDMVTNPTVPWMHTEVAYASGLLHQGPTSKRWLRSNGSSSDKPPITNAHGFIETHLRAGGPNLCELPCQMEAYNTTTGQKYNQIPGTHIDHGDLMTSLHALCGTLKPRFSFVEMFFFWRRSLLIANDTLAPTLVVGAHRTGIEEGDGSDVEIIDLRVYSNTCSLVYIHPCLPADMIFPLWEGIAETTMREIDWTGVRTLGCFRIGNSEESNECPPAILVGVDRLAKRDWKIARDVIVSVLASLGLESVAVIIRKDKDVFRSGHGLDLPEEAKMDNGCSQDSGSDLSSHGMGNGQATLGVWVELKSASTNEWQPFALTCSHSCFPDEDGLPERHMEGVATAGINYLTEQLQLDRTTKTSVRVKEARENGDFVEASDQLDFDCTTEVIARQEKNRRYLQEFLDDPHLLGFVAATSGLRQGQSSNHPSKLSIRDWAMIQARAERPPGKNAHTIVPGRTAFVLDGDAGAVVCGLAGDVVGLLFGGSVEGNIAYFTSTQDLILDIKRVTGATDVRLHGEEDYPEP
ncbi:hypothetical protein BJX99DRAFT_253276 [Aspergillus californicus]